MSRLRADVSVTEKDVHTCTLHTGTHGDMTERVERGALAALKTGCAIDWHGT